MLALSLCGVLFIFGAGLTISTIAMRKVGPVLIGLWGLFALFCLNFFRDPDPVVPQAPNAIVAPGHGKVDCIDEIEEPHVLHGKCRRISIFLSVFDIHVQCAPIAGRVTLLKHSPGEFLNALKLESAARNENVLIGFDSLEKPGEIVAIRLITGLIARRIVPWVVVGETTARGGRVSLIQFGSRVDLYLPLNYTVVAKIGDKVVGGETVIAERA